MLLHDLREAGLEMPSFLPDSTQYLTVMGSVAYGVSTDMSDMDVYGFAVPPKEFAFPHLTGYVHGFDPVPNSFKVFDPHKVTMPSQPGVEYDLAIYSITHYFRLVMGANPNMLDSLFTHDRHVLHLGKIGQMVRENRHLFLSKLVKTKYKGFAYSELQRVLHQKKVESPKLKERIERYGYDIKGAYHVVRLLLEAEQLLLEGDMDLERHVAILTEVRAGQWSRSQVEAFNADMMPRLDAAAEKSGLPGEAKDSNPPAEVEKAVKKLLLDCLEEAYGSLPSSVR